MAFISQRGGRNERRTGRGRNLSKVAAFWPCQSAEERKEPDLGHIEQQPSSAEDPHGVGNPAVRSDDGADQISSLLFPQVSAMNMQEGTWGGRGPWYGDQQPLKPSLQQGSQLC